MPVTRTTIAPDAGPATEMQVSRSGLVRRRLDTCEVNEAHQQLPFTIRMDWGRDGAAAISSGVDVAVVVDVLSFTTTVSVALDSGVTVLPYQWNDDGAHTFAARHDAVLAVRRSVARPGQASLSPRSVRAAKGIRRLVLPSPNGSAIAAELADSDMRVMAGSLRNAQAVAAWISTRHGVDGGRVAVVAAGEQWPNRGLRPAVEDLWGAGAVISALLHAGWTAPSPEALAAARAFESVQASLVTSMHQCASGAELRAMGFSDDVNIAAEYNQSDAVPILHRAAFQNAIEVVRGRA